jgi:myo-inositol-1(or 4)-monophosphatase
MENHHPKGSGADMKCEIQAAVGAALTSGRHIAQQFGKSLQIREKSSFQDLVTNVDRESQGIIAEFLSALTPGVGLCGEEDLDERGGKDRWIIDGLDGTTNFIHGLPVFCVSIALEKEGKLVLGVVYDPLRDELFTACRGQGAFLNGKRITVSKTPTLRESLLASGFPSDMANHADNNLDHFSRFKMVAQEVRAMGSAALTLCYVACSRLDGHWEIGLCPWDSAAGVVIVEEAGGRVTGRNGGPFTFDDDYLVASNGQIHAEMIRLLSRKTAAGD